jgi:integrase
MNGRRGNNEGSIFYSKERGWTALIPMADGKRRWVRSKTRSEVARQLNTALKARQDGLPVPSGQQTYAAFVEKWVAATAPNVRAKTATGYAVLLRSAVPVIGHLPLANVQPADLVRLYKARREAGAAPRTVLHLHRVIFRALRFAERWGDVARNVAALVDAPKVTRTEMTALTTDEARLLLRTAEGDRLAALLLLALSTGMRLGELLGLTWRAVDLERGSVGVVASLQPTPNGLDLMEVKTKRSRRVINIEPRIVAALRRHRAAQLEERFAAGGAWADPDLVFTTETGAPIDGRTLIRKWFRPLLRRAGLPPIRLHDLRHTYASVALAHGVHPKVVQEAMGHSTIAVTLDLYSHVVPTLQRDAAREMGAALLG